jgi:hypothetical protein
MHYLVHYPWHLYKYVTVKSELPFTLCNIYIFKLIQVNTRIRTWCIRYEANHRCLKWVAAFMANFTNVPYTMAGRHQNQQCYSMSIDDDNSDTYLIKPTVVSWVFVTAFIAHVLVLTTCFAWRCAWR